MFKVTPDNEVTRTDGVFKPQQEKHGMRQNPDRILLTGILLAREEKPRLYRESCAVSTAPLSS
jgi:hypothetical protein